MKLSAISFAVVAATTRNSTNPSANVRANGKIMFNKAASEIVGYNPDSKEGMYFRLGKDEKGIIYLVPAKEGEANTLKAAKNNKVEFQFNDVKTIASLGMLPHTRYSLAVLTETDKVDGKDVVTTFYSLTLKTKAEKDAEDAQTTKDHAPVKTEGEIKAAMNRRAPLQPVKEAKPAPTKKELEAAAKKAAKADFKASV